jgi:hypothetical protein
MPLTVTIPDLRLPDTFPVLRGTYWPWQPAELERLAGQLAPGAVIEQGGLWHVGRTDRHLIEVYAASRSFRVAEIDDEDELQRASYAGLDRDKAVDRALEYLAPFRPDGADLGVVDVVDSTVSVSGSPDEEPRRLVLSTDVCLGFSRKDVAFIGPGAKAQVSLRPDGGVQSAYLMWRDVEETGTVAARSADEVAAAFGSMPGFARLTDDTARVEVTSAVAGLYALPPTEPQQLFHPAVELRGTVTTEQASLGFCTWVGAVDPARFEPSRRGERRTPRPEVLVA